MDPYAGQLKILHFNSSEKSQEWTDMTDSLDIPVVLKEENGFRSKLRFFAIFFKVLVLVFKEVHQCYMGLCLCTLR